MSNESYFSQYESPNIVIVPTMSSNPSSPKRRKIGNNIVVPIVSNAECEKQNLKLSQDNKKPDSLNDDKMVNNNESSSKTPSITPSWASSYLQSIGLDKKSSIWNRKIPRKTACQKCVVPVESPTIATPEVTLEKNNFKIPKKNVTDANTTKDSNIKYKNIIETKDRNIKDKLKKVKQSKYESLREVSKNKLSGVKDKNIKKDPNKIKKDNTKKKESHEQPNKLSTSDRHSLPTKSGKVLKSKSQKDLGSKRQMKNVILGHVQKSQKKVEKSDAMPEVTKQRQTKNVNATPSSSYSTGGYEEKYKNPKSSTGNKDTDTTNNVKVSKKCITNLKKIAGLKKAQYNTELNTKAVRKKTEINNKTKTKQKITKSKADLTIKKTIKSPIKKNISKSKSFGKIKLVINLICNNKPNSSQYNESSANENNSGSKTCTVPNVDLDFLNDFDIDEIVESLDTCEKKTSKVVQSDQGLNNCSKAIIDRHCVTSNLQTACNNTSDVIDLIKTLKGEEDDDLMRISIENAKELLFSNELDTIPENSKHSSISDIIQKSGNSKLQKDASAFQINEGEPEILTEGTETLPSKAAINLKNIVINNNVVPSQKEKTSIISKDGTKEIQHTILRRKAQDSKGVNILSPQNTMRRISSQTSSMELDDTKNKNSIKVEEQYNINPFVRNIDSVSVSNKVNTDSYKALKLHKDINENINQEQNKSIDIPNNNFTSFENNLSYEHNITKFQNENNNGSLHTNNLQKIQNTAIVDIHNENKETSNTLKTEIKNNTDIDDFTTDSTKQNNAAISNLHQKNPENLNDFLTYAEKQEHNNAGYMHDSCSKVIKKLSNNQNKDLINNQNDGKTNNSVSEKKSVLSDNSDKTSAVNKDEQKNHDLTKNIIKEENNISREQVQIGEKDTGKHYVEKHFNNNKQKEVSNNNNEIMRSQEELPDRDENTRHNIKCNADIETVLKLEEQLLKTSGSKYTIISNIHIGKFSKIFKCKHPNGKYYALKMSKTNIKYNLGKKKKLMLNSLASNIPKNNLFIVNLTKAFNMGDKWCFLMEYYPKNLDQVLRETGKPFSIEQIQDYARQLVMAVMVLKNQNMVHLDIKPKHILINSANNMLKLCGFDNLCYINKMKVLPNVGTVNYRAPEVILGYESSFEIDVWSTGLVLYEMATNKKLFPGMYNNDILYKQICTLGYVPYNMIKKSRFGAIHFTGSKFLRKSGYKGQNVTVISKFYKNNKLSDSIHDAYLASWSHQRDLSQQNSDIGKLSLFVKLLQKMLTVHPEYRLPIEFVYANPFIYDAYSYQEW